MWYSAREEYGRNDYLVDFIEYYCIRAQFLGTYASDPDRLATLVSSEDFEEWAFDLEDWGNLANLYPEKPLNAEKITKYENEDIPIRAYYLLKALRRLMAFTNAPERMIADFTLLMSDFAPKGAERYAKYQRVLIENPGVPISKLARDHQLDRSTIHTLIKKGVLVKPD